MITTPTHPEIVLVQQAGNAGALFQSVAQELGGLASIPIWGAECGCEGRCKAFSDQSPSTGEMQLRGTW
jgi:hypothetical protein